MPRKKDKKDASTRTLNLPDAFETWLAKQPVISARAKAGYVSAQESKETS